MKATTPTVTTSAMLGRGLAGTLCELVKLRLSFLVLLTTLVGFYLGSGIQLDYISMFHTLLGTGLLACGAAALNQLWEKDYDAQMRRTADRPLPSGRLQPTTVLVLGGVAAIVGLLWLVLGVNLLTAFLGAFTLASYLLVYTPLKRITPFNTMIGAVPGALPPLMGWTAATGELSAPGWVLFGILFFWQLPHFLAIAWIYREEYAKAGFVMLPMVDPDGVRTGRQAITHTLGLLSLSIAPSLLGVTGRWYFATALVLSLIFLWSAIQFSRYLTLQRARQLFVVSIIYLPLLLGFMVVDKIKIGGY